MPNAAAFPPKVRDMLDGSYWRVIVRPVDYGQTRVPYDQLRAVLEETQVRLRGWYFPHLSNKAADIERGKNYYGTWCLFDNYEYWRFYESAQLVHYHGIREAVESSYKEQLEQISQINLKWLNPDWSTITGYIDIINFLYTVTEIFEFAGRLALRLKLDGQMHIDIALRGVGGFILGVSDTSRAWHELYQWNAAAELGNVWDIDAQQLRTGDGVSALEAVVWFFQRFGWTNVNQKALHDVQSAFLRKRP